MKRILMTGAGGFLGSKIRRQIQRSKLASIIAVSERRSVCDPCIPTTASNVATLGPFDNDVLILCGAHYYKGDDPGQIASMRAYNITYTRLVFDQFVSYRGTKIIYLSSYMQLYDQNTGPYADWYVQTKQETLDYIREDPRSSLLNLYIYDTWARDDARPKFVPTLIDAVSRGNTFSIPSPETLMDLCDAESIADAIALFCSKFEEGSFSLCTGMPITLREITESLVSGIGLQGKILYGTAAPHTTCLPYVDIKSGLIRHADFKSC